METKFEKLYITDLLKGNQFNLRSAHFLHQFTTSAIFKISLRKILGSKHLKIYVIAPIKLF